MTPLAAATPIEHAGLLPRVAAAVYDGFLLIALYFLATAVIDPFLAAGHVPAGSLWFRLYLLLVTFFFYGWFWTHGGQTLGMRAWRLRVVDMRGEALRWPQAALRFLVACLAWSTVIGLLLCIGGKPALQDRLSKTMVLRLPRP